MSDDDELRRKLHDIPAPRAGLDAEAIVAGARKRRRPKTIALSSAATVAGVLIVAPLVTPGLSPLLPRTTGEGVSMDSGAAPEMQPEPAPQEEEEGAGGATEGTDGAEDAGSGDSGASGDQGAAGDPGAAGDQAACGTVRAGDVGLALRFLDDPTDGSAELEIANASNARLQVQVLESGSGALTAEGELLAAGTSPASEERGEPAPGETMRVAVELAPRTTCAADGTQPDASETDGIAPIALVIVTRDGLQSATPTLVVGEPYAVR